MSDLEMTKLCAEAMGYELCPQHDSAGLIAIWEDASKKQYGEWDFYAPLHDDAQAMALVKKFRIATCPLVGKDNPWCAYIVGEDESQVDSADLNRAIVECAAKMQEEK